MQKYDFHFIIQLSKWIFRGITKPFAKTELTLEEAVKTGKTVKFTYTKETTGETRQAIGENLHYSKRGNVLYYDLQKGETRSFKPENLKENKFITL